MVEKEVQYLIKKKLLNKKQFTIKLLHSYAT